MAKVTVVGYGADGALLYVEHCDDMSACDVQDEMLADSDCTFVECLEDDPTVYTADKYVFGD